MLEALPEQFWHRAKGPCGLLSAGHRVYEMYRLTQACIARNPAKILQAPPGHPIRMLVISQT